MKKLAGKNRYIDEMSEPVTLRKRPKTSLAKKEIEAILTEYPKTPNRNFLRFLSQQEFAATSSAFIVERTPNLNTSKGEFESYQVQVHLVRILYQN